MDDPARKRQLIAYLLGKLSDEERDALEGELFADDGLFDALLALEEELAEEALDDRPSMGTTGDPSWLTRETARIRELRQAGADAAAIAVTLAAVLRLRLRPGLARDASDTETATIADAAMQTLEIELVLPRDGARDASYHASIEDAGGRVLVSVRDLAIDDPAAPHVTVRVPVAALPEGVLVAHLAADAPAGREEIDDYVFVVRRARPSV
ncbi:MAG: hypothetical protein U0166_26130 [Acidobacteriota bacterium]